VRAISSGKGGDVMGHPLNALAWIAGKLAAVGKPLRRGMIVMTGSMVPIQYPVAGDRVLVEISGLGTTELAVT
jgi:2-keto-4-pentenoate hydratase